MKDRGRFAIVADNKKHLGYPQWKLLNIADEQRFCGSGSDQYRFGVRVRNTYIYMASVMQGINQMIYRAVNGGQ